jgi:hypothetical protein
VLVAIVKKRLQLSASLYEILQILSLTMFEPMPSSINVGTLLKLTIIAAILSRLTSKSAALPLTSITAWEALFDRMDIREPVAGAAPVVLIIGGGAVCTLALEQFH